MDWGCGEWLGFACVGVTPDAGAKGDRFDIPRRCFFIVISYSRLSDLLAYSVNLYFSFSSSTCRLEQYSTYVASQFTKSPICIQRSEEDRIQRKFPQDLQYKENAK